MLFLALHFIRNIKVTMYHCFTRIQKVVELPLTTRGIGLIAKLIWAIFEHMRARYLKPARTVVDAVLLAMCFLVASTALELFQLSQQKTRDHRARNCIFSLRIC